LSVISKPLATGEAEEKKGTRFKIEILLGYKMVEAAVLARPAYL
jgi:hypothetical protein